MLEVSERRLGAALALAVGLHLAVYLVFADRTLSETAPPSRQAPLRVRITQAPAPVPPVEEAPPAPTQPKVAPPTPKPSPPPRTAPAPAPTPTPQTRATSAPPVPTPTPPEPSLTAASPAAPSPPAVATAPAPASPAEREDYLVTVRDMIAARQRYPRAARRRGLESVVTVRIAVAEDGSIRSVRALDDAPRLFERASLEAVADAAPFPPPPPGFNEMEVAIRYAIDR